MTNRADEKRPVVSVVLPTYNQADYLPQALKSVLNQTWQDRELIVVNDGSTDDTPDILRAYQERHAFTVIHQENRKLPRALNAGFRRARGEYLTWTSSDNIMLPRMLEVLVDALDRHPRVGLVYADWEVIDDGGTVIGGVETLDFDRHLLLRTNYINACFLYRRACQDVVGLYDPEYIYVEDWEYWLRIAGSFDMMRVPQRLYQYRIHGDSLSEEKLRAQAGGASVGYRKLAGRLRTRLWAWYVSKLKWEWRRLKLGRDPGPHLQPYVQA
jgi:glycosyltransferase involved in cell wall biosynthesis